MATSYFFLKIMKHKRLRNIQNREAEIKVGNSKNSEVFENYKNNEDFDTNKCRTCWRDGTIPIYNSNKSLDISEHVKTFGNIELSEDDQYPKLLCEDCYFNLQSAILFRKSAKEAESSRKLKSLILKEIPPANEPDDTYSEKGNEPDNDSSSTKKIITYKCKLCRITFKTHKEYLAHKRSKKHKNVRIQCRICYGLLTSQLYKRHLARHQSASHLVCDVCGKLYRKDNLLRHMQLHTYDLPYQCQRCPYRGRFMESLKIHMRTHTGDKPFCCDKCQLHFLTRSNLNRHLLTHKKERPFKCSECARGFYTQRDMDIHFKSDHAGIKDFSCRMCGNKYGTRKALMRHELRVHKRDKMAKGRMPLYLQAEYRK